MKPTTLVFPMDREGRILLGRKKRGFGKSKFNGFGGKLEGNESFRQCAVRELFEEVGLRAREEDLMCVGYLGFQFPYEPSLSHIGYVYVVKDFEGTVAETEEMEPQWFAPEDLPFEHMWKGDVKWVPQVLRGQCVQGYVAFGPDNDAVESMDLQVVESIEEIDSVKPSWVRHLLDWYDDNKRDLPWRDCGDPYKVWVSEIMSQQTRIEAMKPYYETWMTLFPSLEALAAASEEEVVHAWQGLGYYSRARNLRLGAQMVVNEYGGRVPTNRKAMESLKGVGSYTAGAVLSMAYGQHETAVDGNVLRIYARLYGIAMDILSTAGKKAITTIVEETLPYDRPGDFNQALMDFGSAVCIPKAPRCELCPLQSDCIAYVEKRTDSLPVRIVKTKVQTLSLVVGLMAWGDYYLLHRRPDQGLLRSMWEFPTVEGAKTIQEGLDSLAENLEKLLREAGQKAGLETKNLRVCVKNKKVDELTHVFSHRKWLMKVYPGHIEATGLRPEALQAYLPDDWMLIKRQDFAKYAWAGPHGKLTVLCQ